MKKERPVAAAAYGLFASFTGLWIAASLGVPIVLEVIEPCAAQIGGDFLRLLVRALASSITLGGLVFLGTVSVGSIGGLGMMVARGWSLSDALRFGLDFTVPLSRSETRGKQSEE